jgi:hypothetical protein
LAPWRPQTNDAIRDQTDEKTERHGNHESDTESFQCIGKMEPKQIGLHQLAEKLDRLPRRAQSDVADDEIGQLPKQK